MHGSLPLKACDQTNCCFSPTRGDPNCHQQPGVIHSEIKDPLQQVISARFHWRLRYTLDLFLTKLRPTNPIQICLRNFLQDYSYFPSKDWLTHILFRFWILISNIVRDDQYRLWCLQYLETLFASNGRACSQLPKSSREWKEHFYKSRDNSFVKLHVFTRHSLTNCRVVTTNLHNREADCRVERNCGVKYAAYASSIR